MANYLELIEETPPGVLGNGDGYVVDDQSWLGSAHGTDTAESIMLDGATCLARFPDGIVPSGTCLGKITATGKYGPYAASGQVAVNEEQTVRVTNADRGTFSLGFRGQWTAPLNYDASAAQIVAALEALSNIGTGGVTGTGGPVNTADVTLTFAADADVAQLDTDATQLFNDTSEVQTVTVSGATGGTFTLVFQGQQTSALAYNADAATVQAALEALNNVDPGDITVGGGPANTAALTLTYAGQYAQRNVNQVYANSALTGTAPTIVVGTSTEGAQQAYPSPTLTVATTTPGAPPGGTGGLETFVGHLFTTRTVLPKGAAAAVDTSGALFWHGKVIVSKLPPNSGYSDEVADTAKHIRYV